MIKEFTILSDKMQLAYKNKNENICIVGPITLPVEKGDFKATFNWYSWLTVPSQWSRDDVLRNISSMNLAFEQQSSVLVYGDFHNNEDAIIRMHSICHTGDIFGSQRCDCGYQLNESMRLIQEHGCGALFYLASHEGRGIGLFSKALAYILQENDYDTVQANEALGFEDDTRDYSEAILVLEALRKQPVKLITNNPKKLTSLQQHGLLAKGHIPIWGGKTETNEFYLQTKIEKSGHIDVEGEVIHEQRHTLHEISS